VVHTHCKLIIVMNVLCKGSRIGDQIILLRLLHYTDDQVTIVF